MTKPPRGVLLIVVKASILSFAFLLGILYIKPGHLWGDDFALYLHQAEAMLKGEMAELYAKNSYATQLQFNGPDIYPPGYPSLLAVFKLAGAEELLTLKLLNWALFIILSAFAFRLISIKSGLQWISLLVVGFFLLNPELSCFSDEIIADLFFTGLIIVFFSFLYDNRYPSFPRMVILSLLVFAAAVTKTQGLLLLFPFSLSFFLINDQHTKDRFWLYFLTQHILITVLLASYFFIFPFHDNEHASQMLRLTPKQVFENIKYYIVLGGDFLSFGVSYSAGTVLNSLLLIPSLLYFLTHIRKEILVLAWVIPLTTLLVLWPFQHGQRFYLTVDLFLLYGTVMWIHSIKIWRLKMLLYSVMAVLLIAGNIQNIMSVKDDPSDDPFSPGSLELYQFIRRNTKVDAPVYFWKPRLLSWQTHRDTYLYPADSTRIDFDNGIVVFDKTRQYRVPKTFDSATRDRMTLIFQTGNYEVWKINRIRGKRSEVRGG